jgi:hypothetical protein
LSTALLATTVGVTAMRFSPPKPRIARNAQEQAKLLGKFAD